MKMGWGTKGTVGFGKNNLIITNAWERETYFINGGESNCKRPGVWKGGGVNWSKSIGKTFQKTQGMFLRKQGGWGVGHPNIPDT